MIGKLDTRFSEATEPVGWQEVTDALAGAELYWLTTVRTDGRPHVTPLIGAWVDDGFVFCTGPEEQKAQNLAHSTAVAVTTGVNTWNDGLDVVIEGDAERVTGLDTLSRLAEAIREKYDGVWDFTPHEDGFGHTDESGDSHIAYVFKVPWRRRWRSRNRRTARPASAPEGPGSTRFCLADYSSARSWRGVFLARHRRHHGRPHGRPGGAGPGQGRGRKRPSDCRFMPSGGRPWFPLSRRLFGRSPLWC